MTNPNDALAALRDIHLPEAVSFWPLAPGWWLAGFAALTLVCLVAGAFWRRRISARSTALRLLAEAAERFREDHDAHALAAALSSLLRRSALFRFSRSEVASLHGEGWLRFLSAKARRHPFPAEVAAALERGVYAPASETAAGEGEAWISATRGWIRRNT
jgi:hypothetical protein